MSIFEPRCNKKYGYCPLYLKDRQYSLCKKNKCEYWYSDIRICSYIVLFITIALVTLINSVKLINYTMLLNSKPNRFVATNIANGFDSTSVLAGSIYEVKEGYHVVYAEYGAIHEEIISRDGTHRIRIVKGHRLAPTYTDKYSRTIYKVIKNDRKKVLFRKDTNQ